MLSGKAEVPDRTPRRGAQRALLEHYRRPRLILLEFDRLKMIQLQRNFQFYQPSRAVWLLDNAFCQPSGAVLHVERENVIQLRWDFQFYQPFRADCSISYHIS